MDLHGGRMGQGPGKIPLSFGIDPDKGADRGSLREHTSVILLRVNPNDVN